VLEFKCAKNIWNEKPAYQKRSAGDEELNADSAAWDDFQKLAVGVCNTAEQLAENRIFVKVAKNQSRQDAPGSIRAHQVKVFYHRFRCLSEPFSLFSASCEVVL
jgi:hypothetical protein